MKTLPGPASMEIEIKRSRFIAHAARVDTLQDTLTFYESVADPSASHNCWAWQLDHQYRFNDDGEPASSAGKPIYAAIDGKGLDHVMVVVTRHFGGIKLGVGGLIRAYGGAAARCLDKAGLVRIEPRVRCMIETAFQWTGQVYLLLEQAGAKKTGESYPQGAVHLEIEIEKARLPALRRALGDATRGAAAIRVLSTD